MGQHHLGLGNGSLFIDSYCPNHTSNPGLQHFATRYWMSCSQPCSRVLRLDWKSMNRYWRVFSDLFSIGPSRNRTGDPHFTSKGNHPKAEEGTVLQVMGLFLWLGARRHRCRHRKYYICSAPLHQPPNYPPKLIYHTLAIKAFCFLVATHLFVLKDHSVLRRNTRWPLQSLATRRPMAAWAWVMPSGVLPPVALRRAPRRTRWRLHRCGLGLARPHPLPGRGECQWPRHCRCWVKSLFPNGMMCNCENSAIDTDLYIRTDRKLTRPACLASWMFFNSCFSHPVFVRRPAIAIGQKLSQALVFLWQVIRLTVVGYENGKHRLLSIM